MATPQNKQLFTCISCSIAFLTPEEQREHYRSDHHRYNMKRRVAGLPPVSNTIFNEKVLAVRGPENGADAADEEALSCNTCGKTYGSENALKAHFLSKKHKEKEAQGVTSKRASTSKAARTTSTAPSAPVTTEEITAELERRAALAENLEVDTSKCLFCPNVSTSPEDNVSHMFDTHSFFVPDTEYLTDLSGLIKYLHQKIIVGNTCIYCNAAFRSEEATKGHMKDRRHEMLAYSSEKEKLELSDWYDFTTSYPVTAMRKAAKKQAIAGKVSSDDEEWESDEEGDQDEADEIVDVVSSDDEDEAQIAFGDSPYELVLPNGRRIGHRSLKHYYNQNLSNSYATSSKAQKLLELKEGRARDTGVTTVAKRNPGEAKEAGRHIKEFRDMKKRENFKTKVGFRNNNQKHFRDPLLQ